MTKKRRPPPSTQARGVRAWGIKREPGNKLLAISYRCKENADLELPKAILLDKIFNRRPVTYTVVPVLITEVRPRRKNA